MRTHLIKTSKTSLNHFFKPKNTFPRFYNTQIDPNKINSEFKKPSGLSDVENSIKDLQCSINELKDSNKELQNTVKELQNSVEKLENQNEEEPDLNKLKEFDKNQTMKKNDASFQGAVFGVISAIVMAMFFEHLRKW